MDRDRHGSVAPSKHPDWAPTRTLGVALTGREPHTVAVWEPQPPCQAPSAGFTASLGAVRHSGFSLRKATLAVTFCSREALLHHHLLA